MNFCIDHAGKLPLHFQVKGLVKKLLQTPNYQKGTFLLGDVDLTNKRGTKAGPAVKGRKLCFFGKIIDSNHLQEGTIVLLFVLNLVFLRKKL